MMSHPKQKLSLNMKMPNGSRIGDCTFAELASNFTLGELCDVYPNIGFWFRLMNISEHVPARRKATQTKSQTPKKKTPSKSHPPRLNGSACDFIDDEEDQNPSGVIR